LASRKGLVALPFVQYRVRSIANKNVQEGSTANVCALDMSKAFDKISHYEKENSERIVRFASFMVLRMLLLCEIGRSAV